MGHANRDAEDVDQRKRGFAGNRESDQEIHQACQLHATCETSIGRGTGTMEDYGQYVRKHLGKLCPWHNWM